MSTRSHSKPSGDDPHLQDLGGDAETRLRQVVDNLPIVIWCIDKEGVFTFAEGKGLQALGTTSQSAVGKSAFAIYKDNPHVMSYLRRALEGEEFSATVRVGHLAFDTLYSPIHSLDGEIVGVRGLALDVSERLRAEDERAALQTQLLQSQKLESLGVMAGGIAHDFNNLLTAIVGSASAALQTLAPQSVEASDVRHVLGAAHRAAALTRQLLAYGGRGHPQIAAVDLSSNIRELATLLESTVPKKVSLRLQLADGLPALTADVAQLQQVAMNLIINAAEAVGDHAGEVVVSTGLDNLASTDPDIVLAIDDVLDKPSLTLSVRDNGCGMDAATKGKIFDPFFTTKFTGRGLGLAAVLGIVRTHRGAITIRTEPGQGTNFTVWFPLSGATTARKAGSPTAYRGCGSALLIDDDERVREAVRRLLVSSGFVVLEAADGAQGIEIFVANRAEIRLVVLDQTMPKMSGDEVLTELRIMHPEVPIILCSGYSEEDISWRHAGDRFTRFLAKPFGFSELMAAVSSLHEKTNV